MSKTRLMVAVILAFFLYGVITAMLGTVLPSLSLKLHLTPEQEGYLALSQALGLIVASIAAGPLVDNKGKKAGLVLGLGLVSIALLLLPSVGSYGVAGLLWFLMGFGGGTIVTAVNTLASDVSEGRRGSLLNLFNVFFGLGGLVTPLLAAELLGGDATKLAYTVAGMAVLTFLLHSATQMPPPSGERAFRLSETGRLAGSGTLWLLSLMLFLYVACEVGMWNWLARYLIARGVTEATAFRAVSLGFALGLLLGRAAAARVLVHARALMVTLGASVLMLAATLAVLQTSGVLLWAAVFLAGVAMAPVYPTTLAMAGDAFPKATGTAMGIIITSGWAGLAVSSRVIGAIGGGDAKNLQTALLVLPACSALMIVVNVALRPVLRKQRP